MINKFSNTKAFMASFSDKLIKLLKHEITRERQRSYSSGKSINAPINSSGNLAQSLSKKFNKEEDGFSFDVMGNAYGQLVNDGGIPDGTLPDLVRGIVSWMGAKPVTLNSGRTASSSMGDKATLGAANNIARSIQSIGIKPTGFIDSAIENAMDKLNAIDDSIVKDIELNIEEILIGAGYAKKGNNFILE
jgi:hypothetical protein